MYKAVLPDILAPLQRAAGPIFIGVSDHNVMFYLTEAPPSTAFYGYRGCLIAVRHAAKYRPTAAATAHLLLISVRSSARRSRGHCGPGMTRYSPRLARHEPFLGNSGPVCKIIENDIYSFWVYREISCKTVIDKGLQDFKTQHDTKLVNSPPTDLNCMAPIFFFFLAIFEPS